MTGARPPAGLGREGKRFWKAVTDRFTILDHHRALLEQACRSLDMAVEADEQVRAEGVTLPDRWGQRKPHAACNVARDARRVFAHIVKVLGISDEEPRRPGRPVGR